MGMSQTQPKTQMRPWNGHVSDANEIGLQQENKIKFTIFAITLWQHERSIAWWGVQPSTSPESETSISDSTKHSMNKFATVYGQREKKKKNFDKQIKGKKPI